MATFFGEILPVTSRAVEEIDDEEVLDEHFTSDPVNITWGEDVTGGIEKNEKYKCKAILVGVGIAASAFLQTHILHQRYKVLGKSESANDKRIFYVVCLESEPDILICYVYQPPHHQRVVQLTNQLFTALAGPIGEVVVLVTEPLSTYLSRDEMVDDRGHMHHLQTTSHRQTYELDGNTNSTPLPQPNTITGLPAAVVTHCELEAIPAVVHVSYTPTASYIDLDTISQFKDLTPHCCLKYIYKHNSKVKDMLEIIQKRMQQGSQFV